MVSRSVQDGHKNITASSKERNPVTDMVHGKWLQEMRRREHSTSAEQHPESQGFLSKNF